MRYGDAAAITDAAAELEELGFGAVWIPGGVGGDVFAAADRLLGATSRIAVATGVVNVWMHTAGQTAAAYSHLDATYAHRFVLGVGVSHQLVIDADAPGRYRRPVAVMSDDLQALDRAVPPVPDQGRVLAALGPRMLELARDRSRGAHPYLSPAQHTAIAREILGPGRLLAPEQGVLLERDPEVARRRGREYLEMYMARLPNYTRNLLRCGFTPEDLGNGGSDQLVDTLVAWGDAEAIAAQVRRHCDAGADHVAIQVLGSGPDEPPRAAWRSLADALLS